MDWGPEGVLLNLKVSSRDVRGFKGLLVSFPTPGHTPDFNIEHTGSISGENKLSINSARDK